MTSPHILRKYRLIPVIFAAAIVAFMTYVPVLDYPFTGTDTFTLIENGRISSLEDVAALFTKPLMGQSRFITTHGVFYRPVAALSYGIDELIWGLDPFGYHLTDLLLHMTVTMLAAVLVGVLTKHDYVAACAAAVLFAAHPILVENVPAPDHRHDVLGAALLIVSFLFFLRAISQERWSKSLLAASVLFYLVALGAKEIVIFFPALVFCHFFLFRTDDRIVPRTFRAGLAALPFVIATLAYLVVRIAVLGSLGGYRNHSPSGDFLTDAGAIVILYFQDLLYPQDYLGVFDLIPRSVFIAALGICGICVLGVWFRFDRDTSLPERGCEDRRLAALFCFWMILPLTVCLATTTFSHRSMYIPAVPLAALVSCLLVSGLRRLRDALRKSHDEEGSGTRASHLSARVVLAVIVAANALLIGSLVAASPLVRDYPEWRDSAVMSSLLFEKLSEVLPSMPRSVTICLHQVPSAITEYEDRVPRVRGVGYLNDYGIASWFRLFHPARRVDVVVHDRFSPERLPKTLDLRVEGADQSNPKVTVEYPGMPGRRVAPGK